ncbi:hypothetical protein PtA15_10A605 [Puccinia triticina]|uniref:Uncharacterized protein n=1 Tax=Puccinia triticina TaxID=208348 RepID=A0ABY7CV68_9BASI|nr:uncharacterized protein PtA15_10A605 [Puccinia triticina]WAQ89181.1 hypothetical protein PtA15_10A605 [Puccinia triticina]
MSPKTRVEKNKLCYMLALCRSISLSQPQDPYTPISVHQTKLSNAMLEKVIGLAFPKFYQGILPNAMLDK